ncbi:MAG TPA: hypothetical protein VJ719_04235, partial [Chthoniobacterales bacterium]|nr:hypothetical protein [Chthoniobacterales bacterium]
HYHFRYAVGWPIRILLALVSALVATVIVWAGSQGEFTLPMFLILALCAYLPFGWLLHRPLRIRRFYRRHPDKYIEHTATITNDYVATSSGRGDDLRLAWPDIRAVISTPRGILFVLPSDSPWFWLPQSLLDGSSRKEQILELARESNVRVRQMA